MATLGGYGGYGRVPESVANACSQIASQAGTETLELYHKVVLATLIGRFDGHINGRRVPDSVLAQYEREFRRILTQFETSKVGFYVHGNDLFNKDLAICRGKLLPCGAQLVDVHSGVPRSLAVCGGLVQFVRVLAFFGQCMRGFRPLYEMHLDPRSLAQFTAVGWDRCYLRIADLLEANPKVLGVMGASWWFDPEVERITPNISYLRQRPLGAGAGVFRFGSDRAAIGNATKFSRVRKELYEQGRYLPTNYLMAWARRDLLDWARRARAEGLEA